MTRVGKKPSPEYNVTTQLLNSTPPSFCTIKKFIKKKRALPLLCQWKVQITPTTVHVQEHTPALSTNHNKSPSQIPFSAHQAFLVLLQRILCSL